METMDFICNCLHVYKGTSCKIDAICDGFDIDIYEKEVKTIFKDIKDCNSFGAALISFCYDKVIDKAVEKLGANEDLFEKDVNDYNSQLSYGDKVPVHTWKELSMKVKFYNAQNYGE